MTRYFLLSALTAFSLAAFAEAGPICGGELHCEQTSPACPDPTAYVNWETAANGDVNVTIYKDSQTAWRGRGLADDVNSASGWSMTIDGTAVDIASYFEKDYTAPTVQADAPTVYRLRLKDGVTRPTGTVVIKLAPVKFINWWTGTDNNGWGKTTFEYLYGSAPCSVLATPTVTSVAADGTITIGEVAGAASYSVRIYYNETLYALYDGVQSGNKLPFEAVATADYKVTATALSAEQISEESEAYIWHIDATAPTLGYSEICGEQFFSDTYSGGPTNVEDSYMTLSFNTDADGNIVVSILAATANATDSAFFRKADALGVGSFLINGAPASGFFWTNSVEGETTYIMRLREGKQLPLGTRLDYNGTLQWKTTSFPNGYRRNTTFSYTYGTVCETTEEPQDPIEDALEDVVSSSESSKVLIDGQLYIMRGERMYDAQGREVK